MAVARPHRRHFRPRVSVGATSRAKETDKNRKSRSGAFRRGREMKSPRSRRMRPLWKGIAATVVVALLVGTGLSVWWLTREALAVHRLTRGIGDTVFYGADGQPWFRLDEQRHDVSLDDISTDLQHAVVAVEDRRFYRHPGLDPIGVGRAVVREIRYGGRLEGGSTLTQQLARTLFLSNVRSVGR